MQDRPLHPMHLAPRCLARTRSGAECQSPAVRGKKRCRMHGGLSPGVPGNSNALKHGLRSAAHMALRTRIRELCAAVLE